jgi:hypothetical protein
MKGKHIRLPDVNFTPAFITVDDVISESANCLADIIAEAYAKALKEGIKANTVIIDEHFAKVNAFDFVFGRDVMSLPPMICGLEVQVSDELPDGYDFAVLEVPETERERLIRKAKSEVAREIFEEIEKSVALKMPAKLTPIFKRDLDYSYGVIDGKRDALFEVLVLLAELKKKYTEGQK